MLTLILKLLICHLLGDFVLQPSRWVNHKTKYKFRSPFLYFHVFIHAMLLFAFLYMEPQISYVIWILPISHLLIDGIKLEIQNKIGSSWAFVLDQLAHLIIIFIVVNVKFAITIDVWAILANKRILLCCLSLLLISYVSAIVIKILLGKWRIEESVTNEAGKYIGILERLFVFAFIVFDFWSGIGFLIAAKSVFRFSDINNANDRNLTEYIVIGTFLSFGISMLVAILYLHFIKLI